MKNRSTKELSSPPPTLAMYHPARETTLPADASSYGLGTVLTQSNPEGQ